MTSDMNERPEGFRDTPCPVDTHPCEGQGTDADCRACLTRARREADLRGAQLLMVSSELAGDPKMDHADRSDSRWTPTLHEAWCARQEHKENERFLSSVEGYRRDIDNCLGELRHKNQVLRDRNIEYGRVCFERDQAMAAARLGVAQCAQVQDALRRVLPMAEAWFRHEFDGLCDHEPGECTCDREAHARTDIHIALAALGKVAP